jgi:hypothetical protein
LSVMMAWLCPFSAAVEPGHGRRSIESAPKNIKLHSTGNCGKSTA